LSWFWKWKDVLAGALVVMRIWFGDTLAVQVSAGDSGLGAALSKLLSSNAGEDTSSGAFVAVS